ncbi:MAG: LemA family protein, partial [Dehalococcoidia bacterium]|nr:LemA family protein [Dehalococcoidia bacterium]
MDVMVWIAVPVALVVLGWAAWTFNVLVRKRNGVDEGWSQVDVELTRRADLVPMLVATVRGYAAHEEAVFARVAEARAGAVATAGSDRRAVAESGLTGALRSLFAVAEAYPDLLAAETFQNL